MTHLLMFGVPIVSPHFCRAIAGYRQMMPLEKE
jgi:hypothetical protein